MDLTKTAMLVSLSVPMWEPLRVDKKISREVAEAHNAKPEKAGRYNKYLIDKDAPTYVAVKNVRHEIRTHYYQHTLSWGKGVGIIRADGVPDYIKEFRLLKERYFDAVHAFIDDFPRLRGNAKYELNGLYREEDYPAIDDLKDSFDVKLSVLPVPSDSDFRVQISADMAEELKASIREGVNESIAAAMKEAWGRLHERISRVTEGLSKAEPRFHDSLIENLRDECRVLARLNFSGDERLEEMRYQAEQLIHGISADRLKEDAVLRGSVATEAAKIQERMAAFMGKAA